MPVTVEVNDPIAVQAFAAEQLTAFNELLEVPAGRGAGTIDHDAPFDVSINADRT
jgi:hypothetical protein